MVMEENLPFLAVAGDTAAWPNLNKLIAQGALPTNYFADTHPSIGNYFMLTTGQILTNDDSSTKVWSSDNIARRMISAGVSFRVYAEGSTQGYTGGNTGEYVVRHNPFAMLSDVAGFAATAKKYIWPFTQFASDAANNALPQFSFIVPDLMDDAHSGTPLRADSWLQSKVVGPISANAAFKAGGDGILIVDFDESLNTDTAMGGGHVAPVLWGPLVKAGYSQSSTTVYQHQSMLATVMAALDLTDPPGAAANAPLMGEFFVQK
jgi:acid phosphatase